MAEWREHGFTVGMPHMVPGWLSVVELLKLVGDWQWGAVADALGRSIDALVSQEGDRLYASFVNVDVGFPEPAPLVAFGEGAKVHARGRVAAFGGRFVEGLYLFDVAPLSGDDTAKITGPASLAASGRAWASLTSTFVSRQAGNARLKVWEPAAMRGSDMPVLGALPAGIVEHQEVAASGQIPGEGEGRLLAPARTFDWPILPESDLNGAGLLYFARYVAIQDYAIRRLLSEGLDRPLSAALVARLVTTRQRVHYFANAEPWDTVRVRIEGRVLPAGGFAFRADLHRLSDGAWMAAALVEKALAVPEGDKALRLEAGRLHASLHR